MSLGKMPGMKASSQGGKMPGMKASSQGKRRFKSDLSVDMISPPMGDFRHTMHVGRGGDVFGDTSFLSDHGGKGGAAAERPGSPTDSTGNNNGSNKTTAGSFFTRNFRTVVRKTPERPPERPARRRAGSRDLSPPPPPVSPIIKNAISLPQLNMDSPNGCPQRALFPGSVSGSADDSFYTYGLQSGFVTLPRLSSRLDRAFQDSDGGAPCLDSGGVALMRADSFTSFTVDLGPSLMSEVLSLISDRRCLHILSDRRHGLMQAEGDVEESGSDGEEERRTSVSETVEVEEDSPGMSSPTDTTAGGSVSLHHRERSNCSSRDEDRATMKTPDASMGSPPVVQPVMEAERFQRAADMLSRHYGGGTVTHGRSQAKEGRSQATEGRSQAKEGRSQAKDVTIIAPAFNGSQKTTYAFSEEEEIKV